MQPYIRLVEANAGNHIFLPRCINFFILWCYWAKWSVSFSMLYTVSCVLHKTYKAIPSCSVKSSNAFFILSFSVFLSVCVRLLGGCNFMCGKLSWWDYGRWADMHMGLRIRFDSVSLVNNALMLVNIVASGWNKSGPSFTNGPGHLINNKVDHLLENR